MILLIDNFDSFSYILQDYILQQRSDCKTLRYSEISIGKIEELKPLGIIISPGPGSPEDYPVLLGLLRKFREIPILGICLGYQAIGKFYGMELRKSEIPVHGKTSIIYHEGHPSFKNIPSPISVMRYHSLELKSKKQEKELVITSYTDEKIPMSLAHTKKRIWGFQFHPESILTEYGYLFIKNWINQL